MAQQSIFILLALANFVLCSFPELPSPEGRSAAGEMFTSTRGLIDNVVSNLQLSAIDAGHAVGNFTAGIKEKVEEFQDQLSDDADRVRETIWQAVANATSNVVGVGNGIRNCILERKKAAEVALNDVVYNVTICAESRLSKISGLVSELINVTKSAADTASDVKQQAIECANGTSNIFTIGTCLGGLLWQAEVKAATITGQSALLMTRINLSLGALPATLNICAASKFAQAALGAAFGNLNLAQCSLSAITGGQ